MIVCARENGKGDRVNVFLDRGVYDHLGALMESGVDHFEAGITKGAGDDLRAAIVTVQSNFADE